MAPPVSFFGTTLNPPFSNPGSAPERGEGQEESGRDESPGKRGRKGGKDREQRGGEKNERSHGEEGKRGDGGR